MFEKVLDILQQAPCPDTVHRFIFKKTPTFFANMVLSNI